ncbi:hypothetical protein CR513_61660, partial [Mucuna pruriens]
MKKNHVEKVGRRRSLRGEKKRLVEIGKREGMRNPTKNKEGEVDVLRRAPINALKCRVPLFRSEGDVESYLDWEMKVDQVLASFDYHDYEKVKMVTYEFTGYAPVQWNQFCGEIK